MKTDEEIEYLAKAAWHENNSREPPYDFMHGFYKGYSHKSNKMKNLQFFITPFELFSLHAPETIPGWFKHTESEKPIPPKRWDELEWDDEAARKAARDWHHDPIFDLDEEIRWYQENWERYHDQLSKWNELDKHNRYFQWRTFFANSLIDELNKSKQNEK